MLRRRSTRNLRECGNCRQTVGRRDVSPSVSSTLEPRCSPCCSLSSPSRRLSSSRVWTLNSWDRLTYPQTALESRLAPEGPNKRREAADERREGDQDGRIEDKHDKRLRTKRGVHVPYLFPTCNRKIPTAGAWLPQSDGSAKARPVRRMLDSAPAAARPLASAYGEPAEPAPERAF
jgi:hypothetical protein